MANETATLKLNLDTKGFSTAMDGALKGVSSLGVALGTFLGDMASKGASAVINAGKQMSGSVVSMFDTVESARKVAMSNTDEGLDTVNATMSRLQDYANKTVYSFQDMAQGLSLFTAAGIKTEQSENILKGIANSAARVGVGTDEAKRAMLGFSQAISAGKLMAQDWNQVVNAGMGGAKLKQAILDNANALSGGTYTLEQFKAAMEDGAISSEALTKTLEAFGQDKGLEEQASQVTTYAGLWDNAKDGITSAIYDRIKPALTSMLPVLSNLNDAVQSAFKGDLGPLKRWASGALSIVKANFSKQVIGTIWNMVNSVNFMLGKMDVNKSINNITKSFDKLVNDVNKKLGKIDFGKMIKSAKDSAASMMESIEGILTSADVGGPMSKMTDKIAGALEGWAPMVPTWLSNLLPAIMQFLDGNLPQIASSIGNLVSQIASQINTAIGSFDFDSLSDIGVVAMDSLVESMSGILEKADFTESIDNLGSGLGGALDKWADEVPTWMGRFQPALQTFLDTNLPPVIDNAIGVFESFVGAVDSTVGAMDLVTPMDSAWKTIDDTVTKISDSIGGLDINAMLQSIGEGIGAFASGIAGKALLWLADLLAGILDFFKNHMDTIGNVGADILKGIFDGIVNFMKKMPDYLGKVLKALWDFILETNWIDLGGKLINAVFDGIVNIVKEIPTLLKKLIDGLWDFITKTDWLKLGKDVAKAIIDGIIDGLKKLGKTVMDTVKGIFGFVGGLFGGGNDKDKKKNVKNAKNYGQALGRAFSDGLNSTSVGLPTALGRAGNMMSTQRAVSNDMSRGVTLNVENMYGNPKDITNQLSRKLRLAGYTF